MKVEDLPHCLCGHGWRVEKAGDDFLALSCLAGCSRAALLVARREQKTQLWLLISEAEPGALQSEGEEGRLLEMAQAYLEQEFLKRQAGRDCGCRDPFYGRTGIPGEPEPAFLRAYYAPILLPASLWVYRLAGDDRWEPVRDCIREEQGVAAR